MEGVYNNDVKFNFSTCND